MELRNNLSIPGNIFGLIRSNSVILLLSVFVILVALSLSNEYTTAFRTSTPSVVININPGASDPNSQHPYNQSKVAVEVGTNVTWINNDNRAQAPVLGIAGGHSIVAGDPENGPSNIFYSPPLDFGDTYTYVFTKPGIYPYYDKEYSHMRGQVQVIQTSNDTNIN